jgi:hypothetical protein
MKSGVFFTVEMSDVFFLLGTPLFYFQNHFLFGYVNIKIGCYVQEEGYVFFFTQCLNIAIKKGGEISEYGSHQYFWDIG